MPSPLAHATMGYVIYRTLRPHMWQQWSRFNGRLPSLLIATVGLSVLPDLDAVFGFLVGDLGRFHNNVMNSLIVGLVFAVCLGSVAQTRRGSRFWEWFLIALVSYDVHVIMDFLTVGRGVMILWPLSSARYEPAVKLFYGLHWSDGLLSGRHLWTLLTELGFVVFVGVIFGVAHKCLPGKTAPSSTHLLDDGADKFRTKPFYR